MPVLAAFHSTFHESLNGCGVFASKEQTTGRLE